MLLGGPLSVSVNFIVDEFLDENLVIVRRTWPQHWRLGSLDWRSWWRLVLDNLQVYTDSLPAAWARLTASDSSGRWTRVPGTTSSSYGRTRNTGGLYQQRLRRS